MNSEITNSPMDIGRYESKRARCPRCAKGPMVTDSSGAEFFCSNCGYVLKEQIVDTGREWRAFSAEEANQRAHTGSPSSLALHDMGLSTVIGFENRDAGGNLLSTAMRTQIERLRTWDGGSQVHESADRNRRQAFSELKLLVDKLNVNSLVVEKAAYIYRRALERGFDQRQVDLRDDCSLSLRCVQRHGNTPHSERSVTYQQYQQKGIGALLSTSFQRT